MMPGISQNTSLTPHLLTYIYMCVCVYSHVGCSQLQELPQDVLHGMFVWAEFVCTELTHVHIILYFICVCVCTWLIYIWDTPNKARQPTPPETAHFLFFSKKKWAAPGGIRTHITVPSRPAYTCMYVLYMYISNWNALLWSYMYSITCTLLEDGGGSGGRQNIPHILYILVPTSKA